MENKYIEGYGSLIVVSWSLFNNMYINYKIMTKGLFTSLHL